MTFGLDHYVPALKLKAGEKAALAMLAPSVKACVTPLLQVVERRDDKPLEAHVETAFKKLAPAVEGFPRVFLDPIELGPDGAEAARELFARGAALGVPFTPVTGLSRVAAMTVAAREAWGRTGLAVRVTKEEFEAGALPGELERFVEEHAIVVKESDLLVDLGPVEAMIAEGIVELARLMLESLPQLARWRTLTVLASAFPRSMGIVETESHALVERAEWTAWRETLRHAARRAPTFGDWGIQHPDGVEGFDPVKMQASASIRYATETHWLLVKGRGTKRHPPSTQMRGLAGKLTAGPLAKCFAGAEHCAACRRIVDAAKGAPKLGSPTKWRELGTAHHLTTTVRAIQRLHGP